MILKYCFSWSFLQHHRWRLQNFHHLPEIYGKWMFVLDVYYARWFPVFIKGIIKLSENDEINVKVIFGGFSKWVFTGRKWTIHFHTSIQNSQAHEQNIKIIKVDGGAVGLVENENSLLKWQFPVPLIVICWNTLKNIATDLLNANILKTVIWRRFPKYRKSFLTAFLQLGNPFLVKILCQTTLCEPFCSLLG